MAIVDIVLLILLGLSAIKGLTFGFVRQTLGLILTVAVVVLSVMLASSVGGFLQPVFGANVESSIIQKMTAYDSALADSEKIFTVTRNWADGDGSVVASALGLPSFMGNMLTAEIRAVGTGKLIDALPPVISRWGLNIVGFLSLFLLLAIVSTTIQIILRKAINKTLGASMDKILGMVVSVFKTYCIISIVISVFSAIASVELLSFMSNWFVGLVENSRTTSSFPLLYYMSTHNFVGNGIMSWLANIV